MVWPRFFPCSYIYRVGQKNRTCLSVDNSAMVSGKKRVIRQKFQNTATNK